MENEKRHQNAAGQAWPHVKAKISILAVFSLIGPLIGFVLYGFLLGAGPLSVLVVPVFAVLLRGIPIVFAYILGLPPAIVSGLAALSSLRLRRPEVYIAIATFCGGFSSVVWVVLISIAATGPSLHSLPSLLRHLPSASPYLTLAATGAGTGAICGLLTLRHGGFDLTLLLARLGSHPYFSRFRAGDILLGVIGLLSVWLTAAILVPALSQR